jgi:RHS repeat-associated protein
LQVRITATPDVDISKTVNAVVATTTADPNSSNNQVQKSGKGCFIATAAFGSYEHEYLHILRSFRDDYLMTNAPGRTFVENYYKYSPPVANWMEGKDSVKAATRVLLLPLIGAAWLIQAPLVIQICLLIGWFGLTIMWKHWQVSGVVKRALMVFGMMLGLVAGNASADQIYYMHTDHLNTPTLVTNQKREVVWEGVRQPFGETQETIATIRQPLRFPGQYFDSETGLNYNYYRDYDPTLGRYLQSDPIGILRDYSAPQRQVAARMGVAIPEKTELRNLNHNYVYANNNPVMYTDPTGEDAGATIAIIWAIAYFSHAGDYIGEPNGNFNGGPNPSGQDWKCSLGPGLGVLADSCVKDRCIDHDQCYEDNGCNMSSWATSALGGTKSCNRCNSGFFK